MEPKQLVAIVQDSPAWDHDVHQLEYELQVHFDVFVYVFADPLQFLTEVRSYGLILSAVESYGGCYPPAPDGALGFVRGLREQTAAPIFLLSRTAHMSEQDYLEAGAQGRVILDGTTVEQLVPLLQDRLPLK
ncbi:hypothetical protein HY491_02160 [Candidatus Woesearchaeota archaeon]|nr:hypothetical protein [Candidatus Woesearchaeota archaeon]